MARAVAPVPREMMVAYAGLASRLLRSSRPLPRRELVDQGPASGGMRAQMLPRKAMSRHRGRAPAQSASVAHSSEQ